MHNKKVKRLVTLILFSVVFLYLHFANKIKNQRNEQHFTEILLDHTNVFVHSVYYYKTSKSLGRNAIAIVMTLHKRTVKDITKYRLNIIGTNQSTSLSSLSTLSIETVQNARCDYVMTLSLSNTVDNLQNLEIGSHNVRTLIPFKEPILKSKHPIIFCIAPQFVAEEWQSFLTQVHISNKFGSHLHIYLVSIIDSYFELMQEYEKLGYLTIDHWLTIKFNETHGPYLEPNRNVELRNQAAAQTDCLLKYKEAVEFIGFLDMDDYLIPSYDTYYEEFTRLFKHHEWIGSLTYPKYDYKSIKDMEFLNYSISSIVKNSKPLFTTDLGKSIVRPEHYNSTWIHFTVNLENSPVYKENKVYYRHRFNIPTNGIFHIRKFYTPERAMNWSEAAIPKGLANNNSLLIKDETLIDMDNDFRKMLSIPKIQKIAPRLPKEEFYRKIVYKCYYESFYKIRDMGKLKTSELCINAYDCVLPQRDDIKCIHSDATYHSGPLMKPFRFHYASNLKFSDSVGCYQ